MGAGASAAEAVKGASAEDLQAALGQLPEADRARVEVALISATNKKDAPFLAEYFKKAQARAEEALQDEAKMMEIAFNAEASKKMMEECKAWWIAEAKPLLAKSFKHHDTQTNDLLDKEEAAVFFAHLVAAETQLSKAMMAMSIEKSMQAAVKWMEALIPPDEREALRAEIGAQIKTAIAEATADAQKKQDRYLADKATHDTAAFKVLDTNDDGTLQLSEFLAAFEPESERNIEMHIALGFLTKEEVELQKQMAAATKESLKDLGKDVEGCPQQ